MMRRCVKFWTGRVGCRRGVIAVVVLLVVVGGAGVASGAVQNIFVGMDTIADIQIGGEHIDQIMYQGTVLWEREAPKPPEPDPSTPTTYGAMQTMTNAECSSTRGTAFDARNGQTYYVQKIGTLCWMETNLRYAGDGDYDNTWGYTDDRYATTASNTTSNINDDTRPLTTVSGTQASAYEVAQLANPGGSTGYTNTTANGGFYGYLYNWCAAMGGQPNACNNTSTTGFEITQSICPAGWRLPTGRSAGEFQAMANAIGATNDTTGSTNLRTNFLAVYSGYYVSGLAGQGSGGLYWSSSAHTATAYHLYFSSGNVNPNQSNGNKYNGFALRCVL